MSAKRRSNPVMVMLEDMQAQNRVVLEAVVGLGEKLDREIASLRAELIVRIDRLEAAVRQNSRDIQQNSEAIQRLDARVGRVEAELAQVKAELQQVNVTVGIKAEAASLAALELRVAALERRVGT